MINDPTTRASVVQIDADRDFGARMHPNTKTPSRWSTYAFNAGPAVATAGVIFGAIAYFAGPSGSSISPPMAVAGTAVVGVCGVALGAMMRLLAVRSASFGQWTRRSSAGALLLTPALLVFTTRFMAPGWDFDTCGTLINRNRPTGANMTEFRSACDVAASNRLLHAVILAAAGCVVAVGYGWLLRRRTSGIRDNPRR
jgi:hypothetical protein